MISAQEAKELSTSAIDSQVQKELSAVEQNIRRVASGGNTYVHISMYLSDNTIAELKRLGYTVEPIPDGGDPLMNGTRYCILW